MRERMLGIILAMLVTRSILKRLTALLLPAAFLWLCAACVFICGRETAGAADHLPAAHSVEVTVEDGEPVCDGCPFASFPKAMAPERAAFDAGSQTPTADLPPTPPSYSLTAVVLVHPHALPPATAPPLELLSTLRI
jgi:hypothetical protein